MGSYSQSRHYRNIISGGQDTGVFVSDMTGLTLFTTYHLRAYATNSAGTAYGADIAFTTLANITEFWVFGDYNGWTNSDAASYIISTPSTGVCQDMCTLTEVHLSLYRPFMG